MAKKFFLISQVFYPDEVSTANLFTLMASTLAREGIDAEVWAGQPSYTGNIRMKSDIDYSGIRIKYLPSTNFRKTCLAGRALNIFTFSVSASVKLLFSAEKYPVWTHTTPPFTGILLSFICSLKGRKFVYILLDIFPEGLVRLGMLSGRNPFVSLWHKIFLKSLKKSTIIITIGRDIRTWVNNYCFPCSEKIRYIPHWQDDTVITSQKFEENIFVSENNLKDKFVVQYSGNMGLWNEIRILGKAAMRKPENVIFLYVGDGYRKNELLEELSYKEQENVILLPFQPNEAFNSILNASHVHIVTLANSLEGIAVPCKIYGILAAGKPVIALVPKDSEIAMVVREEECGIVLDPTDIDGLMRAIEVLRNDPGLRLRYGVNGRNAFINKYAVGKVARQYMDLLDEISY